MHSGIVKHYVCCASMVCSLYRCMQRDALHAVKHSVLY
jgi:hypothetical protein